jgi:hypothetical protein
MWDDDEPDFWNEEDDHFSSCEICGAMDDGFVMCCATCSNDRVCGDCRSECSDYCKDCEPEAVFYHQEKDVIRIERKSWLKPINVILLGPLEGS